MLPLSIEHQLTFPGTTIENTRQAEWWRPANIPFRASQAAKDAASWVGLFVCASVIVALGYVWVRLMVVDVGYRLSATRQLVERLEQEGRILAVEAAAADTPGRLEGAAHRLGFRRPEAGEEAMVP